jgi:hypothetical protein
VEAQMHLRRGWLRDRAVLGQGHGLGGTAKDRPAEEVHMNAAMADTAARQGTTVWVRQGTRGMRGWPWGPGDRTGAVPGEGRVRSEELLSMVGAQSPGQAADWTARESSWSA